MRSMDIARGSERGAALVVAIAVLTILLAIGLTFFTVSRLELKTSTNVENTVRAELLADAAINIAISFLKQDAYDHPTYTSLDHAWRTYFNGAWIQGKEWAFPFQGDNVGLSFGSVPTISFARDTIGTHILSGGGGVGNLYVPRRERDRVAGPPDVDWHSNPNPSSAYNLSDNPFVIDPEGHRNPVSGLIDERLTPAQQVNQWADVDNNGDGWNDSVWIPLAADTYTGNVVDGETGTVLVPGDAADNDLDNGLQPPTLSTGVDEANETPVFLYYGGGDSLDNDGINGPDDPLENRWFLTAPINSINAANNFYVVLRGVSVPGFASLVDVNSDPELPWPTTIQEAADRNHRWVDVLDNDYDLVINKHTEYYTTVLLPTRKLPSGAYDETDPVYQQYIKDIADLNATAQTQHIAYRVLGNLDKDFLDASGNFHAAHEFDNLRGVQEISPGYLGNNFAPTWRIKSTGEPVCEVVGRVAVLVTDEASKANLNTGGGYSLELGNVVNDSDPVPNVKTMATAGTDRGYWHPAAAHGASPSEYYTPTLPRIGVDPKNDPASSNDSQMGRARKFWNMLMGAPFGGLFIMPFPGEGEVLAAKPELESEYIADATLPGYGFVDDNGNALTLAMNGIDDDGDGMIDEGLNPAYPLELGLFEGVDEPGEFRSNHPFRDLAAEGKILRSDGITDTLANDGGNAVNAFGELGDRPLRTREEAKKVLRDEYIITDGRAHYPGENPDTTFNRIKNLVTLHSEDKNQRPREMEYVDGASPLLPPVETYDAAKVLQYTKLDYRYASGEDIAQALKLSWRMDTPTPNYTDDGELAFATGLQLEGITTRIDPGVPAGGQNFISPIHFLDSDGNAVPVPYNADPELRALQLGVNVRDKGDLDFGRSEASLEIKDLWWDYRLLGAGFDQDYVDHHPATITHKVTGNEGIRITEMMVRATRRVEAEMYKDLALPSLEDPSTRLPFNPNLFSRYLTPSPSIANPNIVEELDPAELARTHDPIDFDMDRGYMETAVYYDQAHASFVGYPDDVSLGPWPPAKIRPAQGGDPRVFPYWFRSMATTTSGIAGAEWLGDQCVLNTPCRKIPVRSATNPDPAAPYTNVPNIIEFKFGPGPGLPPGRYYLTVNTLMTQRNPLTNAPYKSVYIDGSDQLRYAVKYAWAVPDGSPDIPQMPLKSDGTPMTVAYGVLDPATGRSIPAGIVYDVYKDLYSTYDFTDPNPDTVMATQFYRTYPYWQPSNTHTPMVGYEPGAKINRSQMNTYTPEYLQDKATGFVFLPTYLPNDIPAGWGAKPGYGQDEGLTVTIPPYADDEDHQVYLYVAVCMGPDNPFSPDPHGRPEPIDLRGNGNDDDGDGYRDDGPGDAAGAPDADFTGHSAEHEPNSRDDDGDGSSLNDSDFSVGDSAVLAVNFFEFSQEPDHEWVELENVSGETVDISGWQVVIGAPNRTAGHEDEMVGDNEVILTVPERMTSDASSKVILESRPPNNRITLAINAHDGNPFATPEMDWATPNGIDDDGDGWVDDGPLLPTGDPNPFANPEDPVDVGSGDDHDGEDSDDDGAVDDKVVENLLLSNKIAMVGADLLLSGDACPADFRDVTAPPIPAVNPFAWPEPIDLRRNGIDDDGDGIADDGPIDPDTEQFPTYARPETKALGYDGVDNGEDPVDGYIDDSRDVPAARVPYLPGFKNFSVFRDPLLQRRIVQAHVDMRNVFGFETFQDLMAPQAMLGMDDGARTKVVGELVLRGGVLPDYPEHDGIDNDNDDAILTKDKIDNNGNDIFLENNTVDDNGDGNIDEPGDGADEPGEGIDEGRYRMDLHGIEVMPDGTLRLGLRGVPGSFSGYPVEYTSSYFDFDPLGAYATYLGDPTQPPEWKEFVERRFFPGDNVVVTLFQGDTANKRIVDRATYTERDVINRSIDDGMPVPLLTGTSPAQPTLFGLDGYYQTFWQDNTMAVDFYRTLERKVHPLYNGDRFGTMNRWDPTDGNYDDWAHGIVPALPTTTLPDWRWFYGTPQRWNETYIALPDAPLNMNTEEAELAYLGLTAIENFDGNDASARLTRDWIRSGMTLNPQAGVLRATGASPDSWMCYDGPPLPDIRANASTNSAPESRRWTDYRFSCDFQRNWDPAVPDDADFRLGFMVRAVATRNNRLTQYYEVMVKRIAGVTGYDLLKVQGNQAFSLVTGLAYVEDADPPAYTGPAVVPNVPLTMEIVVEGDRIHAMVNGVEIQQRILPPVKLPVVVDGNIGDIAPFYQGSVGFKVTGAEFAFDNVYVAHGAQVLERTNVDSNGNVSEEYAYTTDHGMNRALGSVADTMTVPYVALEKTYVWDPRATQSEFGVTENLLPATTEADVNKLRVGKAFPNDAKALLSLGAMDAITLAPAQADFYIVYPTLANLSAGDWPDALAWKPPDPADTNSKWHAPYVWRPVFLYSLRPNPADDVYRYQALQQDDPGTAYPAPFSLDTGNFLFNNPLSLLLPASLAWLDPQRRLSRWPMDNYGKLPLSTRAVAYVVEYPPVGAAEPLVSEAVFVWNADDGLVNGVYDVYIDVGGDVAEIRDASNSFLAQHGTPLLTAPLAGVDPTADHAGVGYVARSTEPHVANYHIEAEVFTDLNGDGRCWTGTKPTFSGLNYGEAAHSNASGEPQPFVPDSSGYVHYGTVKVVNTFLAVALRNQNVPGSFNRFMGVVLAPRNRSQGRINVNTVETIAYDTNTKAAASHAYLNAGDPIYKGFNTLIGIPGVLMDDGQQLVPADFDPSPADLHHEPNNPRMPWLDEMPLPHTSVDYEAADLLDRARLIEMGRPNTRNASEDDGPQDRWASRWDGRYYKSLSEMVSPEAGFKLDQNSVLYPLSLWPRVITNFATGKKEVQPEWLAEVIDRFSRMANLVTTRSDIFEILVTVQAGYGIDANNDGIINYRSNDEFITTSEKKARTVYER